MHPVAQEKRKSDYIDVMLEIRAALPTSILYQASTICRVGKA